MTLEIQAIELRRGSAAFHFNATVRLSGITAVLGPSGSGKSSLLECLAGFLPPQSGAISMEGRDLLNLPIERRGIGYLTQENTLFPFLSVYENIAFGLRRLKQPAEAIDSAVRSLAEELRIAPLLERRPDSLSGGEIQRVHLARALAPNPRLLLLDEPLASLDPALRRATQTLLVEVARERNLPMIWVTHDRSEAFRVARALLIICNHAIVDAGEPLGLYRAPRNRASAEITGAVNLLAETPSEIQFIRPDALTESTQDGVREEAALLSEWWDEGVYRSEWRVRRTGHLWSAIFKNPARDRTELIYDPSQVITVSAPD